MASCDSRAHLGLRGTILQIGANLGTEERAEATYAHDESEGEKSKLVASWRVPDVTLEHERNLSFFLRAGRHKVVGRVRTSFLSYLTGADD